MAGAKIIFRNVFSNWIGLFSEIGIAFFIAPIVIHSLGDVGYGIWVLLLSITGYFGLLTLGLRPAINKYVAEYSAKRDPERLNCILNTALSIYGGTGLVILAASIALAMTLDRLPFVPPELLHLNRWIFVLVGLQVAVSLPAVVLGGVLSGLQRYDIHNAIGVSINVIRAALLIFVLQKYPTVLTLAFITFGIELATCALTILVVQRQYPQLRWRLIRPSREAIFMLSRYCGVIAFITISEQMFYFTDAILVSGLVSVAAVTHYTIATNLLTYARRLVQDSTNVLNPAASAMNAGGRQDQLATLWIYATKASLAMVFPLTLGMIFLGGMFIALWMGPNYAGSAKILTILIACQAPLLAQCGTRAILYGLERHRVVAKLTLIMAVIYLGLGVFLAHLWGAVGIALGNGIAAAVIGMVGYPWTVSRQMGLPLRTYIYESYLTPAISAIPMAITLALMSKAFPSYSWLNLIAQAVIASCIYGSVAFFLCLKKKERKRVYSSVRTLAFPTGQRDGSRCAADVFS
jgi:O-antigen/teichoic acid export membrane protein